MIKKTFVFLTILAILFPVWAKNTVVLRVSCTIPETIKLPANEEEKQPLDIHVQYEKRIVGGQEVLLKTVVSK